MTIGPANVLSLASLTFLLTHIPPSSHLQGDLELLGPFLPVHTFKQNLKQTCVFVRTLEERTGSMRSSTTSSQSHKIFNGDFVHNHEIIHTRSANHLWVFLQPSIVYKLWCQEWILANRLIRIPYELQSHRVVTSKCQSLA